MVTGDLERFREASRRLEERLQEASRSDRFKPPTGLATARLHQASIGASEGVPGEVLDLSVDGLKMAIHASHALAVGQNWSVVVGDGEGGGLRPEWHRALHRSHQRHLGDWPLPRFRPTHRGVRASVGHLDADGRQ